MILCALIQIDINLETPHTCLQDYWYFLGYLCQRGLSLLMHPLNEAWLKLEIEPHYNL